ncbi:MFS transporter [Sphingomonas colocasiae]|uniref:MFS transporter n=1 Tax=Sphingomonas colocasiae TaxID=1848973 RepID=A0ABS7PVI4_9SPHN|nr:MFS transporter [Sphingomonas colocasiae]MBY8823994.1 MFS transporter [Sphingomonas colocasiae]
MTTPAPLATRASGYAWYVALLMAAAHLLSFVDRFLMSLVMEPLKADLGVSDAQLGLLQGTGFVILYTVAAVPLGRMADRVNRRNLIIAGILIWSLATALCGLANSFGSLFLARVGVGFGEAALVPAAMSLLAAYFPRNQLGRAVSLFTTGASLGKSLALVGGGALLAMLVAAGGLSVPGLGLLAPWQGTFVLMALPGIALAALLLTVREPARSETDGTRASMAEAFAYLRQHRAAYLLHVAAAASVVLVVQSFSAWTPSYYVRYFDLTPAAAGVAVGSVILIGAPLGHLCGGILTDLFQTRRFASPAAPVMMVSLMGSLAVLFAFVSTTNLTTSLVLLGLLNVFMTLGAPASLAGVQMLTPDRLRGVVTAVFLACTTLIGIGCGPPLVGLTADLLGGPLHLATALLIILSTIAVIGTLAALASRTPFARTVAANAAH